MKGRDVTVENADALYTWYRDAEVYPVLTITHTDNSTTEVRGVQVDEETYEFPLTIRISNGDTVTISRTLEA
jgi:hypothetical protein